VQELIVAAAVAGLVTVLELLVAQLVRAVVGRLAPS
jgi:hypothetical protein